MGPHTGSHTGSSQLGIGPGFRPQNKVRLFTMLAVTAAGGVMLLNGVGCVPPPTSTPSVAGGSDFIMPPTRVAAIRVLGPKATQFSQDVSHFPGVTGADHRKALVIALDDLTEILQLINGPEKSPELVNSLATIAEARQVAEMQSIPYPRMVGTENQALSAIDSALTEMTTRFLIDKDQLPALLETLKAKVATAAASEGSMHDLDAGYAFQAADSVVQQITTDLQAMIHDLPDQTVPVTPAPVPPAPVSPMPPVTTPPPASAPTTGPAPMPAATPTP